jgi:predicted enzyme related to lactoylglutathione lyase
MSNRVVHFEIPCDDEERARSFYASVFDWQMMPIPEMGYTLVTTGPTSEDGPTEPGFVNGGLMKRVESFAAPDVVIDVADIEDALRRIEENGGKTVSERMEVGDMGYAAYFTDPEGNLVGLWETRSPT